MSGEAPMCDACHTAHALVAWWHELRNQHLELCGHHSAQHGPALRDKGWGVLHDERVIETHSLGPVTADPATH